MAVESIRGPSVKMKTPFQRLPLGSVRPTSWIKQQIENDLLHGFAGCLDRLTPRAATNLWRNPIDSQQDQVSWWDAETRGNWLWGLTMAAFLTDSPRAQATARRAIEDWLAIQEGDGYLGIYRPSSRFKHPPGEQGELWAMSRALLAVHAYAEITGCPQATSGWMRGGALLVQKTQDGTTFFSRGPGTSPHDGCGAAHGLCATDVFVRGFEATGDRTWLDAAAKLVEEFDQVEPAWEFDDLAPSRLRTPKKLRGHAVHTVEHVRPILAAVRGGRLPVQVLETALRKIQRYQLPSGSVIGDESIRDAPTPDIGYEYCTMVEWAMSLAEAGRWLRKPRLFDALETLLYSAAQGARMPDGSAIAYLASDNQFSATASRRDAYSDGEPGRRFKFSPTHEDVACCCNPNSVRLMPQAIADAWAATEGGFALCLFAPCTLKIEFQGTAIEIEQVTDYPHDDQVKLRVRAERPIRMQILVRRPSWPGSPKISGALFRETRDGWIFDQVWHDHQVTIHLNPSVRREVYATGEVAILRGPVQFVQEIPCAAKRIKDYPLPGFHDYDLEPEDLPETPSFESNWQGDSRVLANERGEKLVPMASTRLRRAGLLPN